MRRLSQTERPKGQLLKEGVRREGEGEGVQAGKTECHGWAHRWLCVACRGILEKSWNTYRNKDHQVDRGWQILVELQ